MLQKPDLSMNQLVNQLSQDEAIQYIESCKKLNHFASTIHADLAKKAKDLKQLCMYPGCDNETQTYCHLLQRNGILSNISVNNHLMQPKIKDIFKWESQDILLVPLEMRKVGVKQAFTGKLFCSYHDTDLFKSIEISGLDVTSYNAQILLTYRSICNEISQLSNNLFHFTNKGAKVDELKNFFKTESISHRVYDLIEFHIMTLMSDVHSIPDTQKNINNLSIFKRELENEIDNPIKKFEFVCIETDLLEVAAASVLSPEIFIDGNYKNNTPYFLQLIPYNKRTYFIIGYHKSYSDSTLASYVKGWSSFSKQDIQIECSRLLLTRTTNWCMSPKFYNNLSIEKQSKLLKYHMQFFTDNGYMISQKKWEAYNLFAN